MDNSTYGRSSLQKPLLTPQQTLYFYIPISGHSRKTLSEIDFGFSFKIPLVDTKNEISSSSEYCILNAMLFIKSTSIYCLVL